MQDQLSSTFAALADPTRRAILARLSEGETSVSELAQPFLNDMSLPAVTKHLKVLEKAGLITKSKEAQWRPCKLNGDKLKDAAEYMEQYRIFWEESLDRLGEYLKAIQESESSPEASPSFHNSKIKKAKGKKNVRKKQFK